MIRLALNFVVIFLVTGALAHPATVNNKITGAKLSNVVIAKDGLDPCDGVAVGDPCPNGVLYAGTGFAGLGSYKYMTTPGNCSNFVNNYTAFTPTCDGATDVLTKRWANMSGTTAWAVNTGANSTTDGASNTTILATNYTDTDAARYCQNMIYPAGGYTDWYLPAKDELNLVLYSIKVAGKGNFVASTYWSSMENSAVDGWFQFFNDGVQSGGTNSKLINIVVRCVRKY